MIVEGTSSIFQNTSFCNSKNLSQIKISWEKKNISKIGVSKFYTLEGRYTLTV